MGARASSGSGARGRQGSAAPLAARAHRSPPGSPRRRPSRGHRGDAAAPRAPAPPWGGAPHSPGDGAGCSAPSPRKGTQRGTLPSPNLPFTSRLAVEVGRWDWGAEGSPDSRNFLPCCLSPLGRGFPGWLVRRDGTGQTRVSCRGQGPSPRPAGGRRDTGLAPGWGQRSREPGGEHSRLPPVPPGPSAERRQQGHSSAAPRRSEAACLTEGC
ncbi:acetylcholinesterase collagenic tail peptide-like [Prinia subflava]|uniref:acetylcholinesterase collagenic tail peptide-like n=1 Tax=Prinia subflava TaxID=208062 RepID=UPI002FDF73A7